LKVNLKQHLATINSNFSAGGNLKQKGKSGSKGRKTGHGKAGAEGSESQRGS